MKNYLRYLRYRAKGAPETCSESKMQRGPFRRLSLNRISPQWSHGESLRCSTN